MSKIRRLDFLDVSLYGVTASVKDPSALPAKVEKALAGGADAIQLRTYDLTDRAFVELGKKVQALCAKAEAHFIVDNRIDIALVLDADGVHLGHNDLPISFARQVLGHRKIIGASTHSLPQALEAQKQGADYVSCGPVWSTPTKPDYPAVGVKLVGMYHAALKVPFVCIGGIDETNIDEVLNAGGKAIAVVRALFDAADPESAAKNLKQKILNRRTQSVA